MIKIPEVKPLVENKKKGKKRGRPSKYKKKYCKDLLQFFDRPLFTKELVKIGVEKRGTKDEYKLVPNDIPFFSEFARKIGVNTDTLHEWREKYPEFSEAYKKAKEIQKEFLIKNGLSGLYNPTFAIFTAKNITDMRDKVEIDGEVRHVVTLLPEVESIENRKVVDLPVIEAEYEHNDKGNKEMETPKLKPDQVP